MVAENYRSFLSFPNISNVVRYVSFLVTKICTANQPWPSQCWLLVITLIGTGEGQDGGKIKEKEREGERGGRGGEGEGREGGEGEREKGQERRG